MVMFIILIKSLEKLELKIQGKINWLIEKEKGKKVRLNVIKFLRTLRLD